MEAYGGGAYLGKPVELGSWTLGKESILNGTLHSAPEASRPPSAKSLGAGSPFQPALFGHSSFPGRDIDPHPKEATAQSFVPREPRGAGPGNRAGSRRGPEAAEEEAAPEAAMAEGRGSSLLYSLRLISLGLGLTASLPGELQSSRAGAGSPPRPRVQTTPAELPTSAPPSGPRASVPRLRAASADGGPAPLLPGLAAPRLPLGRPC